MLALTLCAGLSVVLVWLAHRYWMMRRDVSLLAEALRQRTSFLLEEHDAPHVNASWHSLTRAANELVRELETVEERRRAEGNQLETTLRTLREAVVVLDRDNYIVLANNVLSEILPITGDVTGERVERALHSLDFLRFAAALRAGDLLARTEVQLEVANHTVWVELSGALIPGTQERNGPWALFVLHDITRQKRLEEIRKQFVANVSHELKTPLSVIKGYAQTLVDDHVSMAPEDRETFIRTVLRHTDRLIEIVEDLLTLSRLEATGASPELSRIDLAEIVRNAAEDFGPRYAKTGHVLHVSTGEQEIVGEADPLKLSQALSNLLENSQKHTPRGTFVTLEFRRRDAPDRFEVSVSDNGPGIPAADLPHIFERFYRVEKGRSREKGGSGLGLSIVKHIVQLHGGSVWAESEPGKSTRISFSIPISAVGDAKSG
jgi:two-component system, OmpR family, phosphate regulon sensor histidine kinase PhoR